MTHCLKQLDNEAELKQNKNIASVLSKRMTALEDRLFPLLDKASFSMIKNEIDREFSDLLTPPVETKLIHDVSDTLHQKIQAVASGAITQQYDKVNQLTTKLKVVNQQIDDSGVNIARAPEQELLNTRLEELNSAQAKNVALVAKAAGQKEKIKGHLREAIKSNFSLSTGKPKKITLQYTP